MKIVLQRVRSASVYVGDASISEIGPGLLLFIGVAKGDGEPEANWLAEKVTGLRIFNDEEGKMNWSVKDIEGEILAVSQFTLLGDARKGKRPSFLNAAPPREAESLFDYFCEKLSASGVHSVKTGSFGAMMDVTLTNDGPVTILLER